MPRLALILVAANSAACLPALPDAAPQEECPHEVTVSNPCGPSQAAPWPMFHQNARHTGQSLFRGPTTSSLKWSFATDAEIHGAPSIGADATVYFTSHDRRLYALSQDGALLWSTLIGESHGTVAIRADGVLYVTSEEIGAQALHAINPDGTQRWKYEVDGEVHSSPTISPNGTIYFCSHDGLMHAVGPDGMARFTTRIGECHGSPALGDDGTIYIGSEETNELYALGADGEVLWRFPTGGGIESSPAVGDDGTIYVGSNDGKLYAVMAAGSKLWEFPTAGPIASSPAISGGRSGDAPGCAPGVILVGSRDGRLYAVSPAGDPLWSYQTGLSIAWSSPAVSGDAVTYIGGMDGRLYAVDCDGTMKWDFAAEGPISNSSAALGADGTLYFGSDDGYIYALEEP